MLKLSYAISDYSQLINEGYHYVDRTALLAQLEQLNERYLFFLRPRRFGKTLFISLLQHYYGLEFAPHFATYFGRYAVGRQPTARANSYLVLRLEFSRINTQTSESTVSGFLNNVKQGISFFLTAYRQYFSAEDRQYILAGDEPSVVLNRLFEQTKNHQLTGNLPHKIYLLIDEYDHFVNELVAFRLDDFKTSVGHNGFVRKFYESIKTATAEGIVDRLFITGVSPLTLDSLTSGFNIGTHLTLDIRFHNLMGFTEQEVATILQGIGVTEEKVPAVLDDIRQWYNGYLFHPKAQTRLYNPDMVLYFASKLSGIGEYPEELLDTNIASDYGKVRQLFKVEGQEVQNYAVLQELITEGQIGARLTRQFSFEKAFTYDDFVSLLFYLGIITVRTGELSRLIFEAPNFVIRQLYFDYFQQLILQQSELRTSDLRIYDRVIKLAQENDPQPLVEAVEAILLQLSNRDAGGFDEKYVKAIFASLLYSTQIYTIHSEYETDRRYVDLLLTRRPPIDPNFQFAFELKYLKQQDAGRLENAKSAAVTQMRDYLQHEKLGVLSDLRAWVVCFVGPKAQVVVEVTASP
ncbi:MAG: AAA family ATPase [Caldilineaceae bacterium]